jgi:hypothetical protein
MTSAIRLPVDPADVPSSLMLRASVRLRRGRLDERLADGADPVSERELELRAQQICSPASRERIARALERTMRDAHTSPPLIRPQVRIHVAAIRASAADIAAVIRRLRDGDPVDPQGVALAQRLLTDGASPLYVDGGQSLRHAVRSVRLALDPLALDLSGLPTAA